MHICISHIAHRVSNTEGLQGIDPTTLLEYHIEEGDTGDMWHRWSFWA